MDFIAFLLIYCTVSLGILVIRANKRSDIKAKKEAEDFWGRENASNSVRRADISSLDYITVPVSSLPTDVLLDHNMQELSDTLLELSHKKILNLSGYSNTDLKMLYGPANLEELSSCDENFTHLIRTLNSIGVGLNDAGASAFAKAFLEYAVSIGSDISSTYTTLGEIYVSENDTSSLDKLIEKAGELSSISGPTTIIKLNNIKSGNK